MRATKSTLLREYTKLIEEDGWYVVHLHKFDGIPCSRCLGGEPNPRCTKCLGFGVKVSLNVIKVRDSFSRYPDSLQIKDTPVGEIGEDIKRYFCLPSARPIGEGDLILEVIWSEVGTRAPTHGNILSVMSIYEINHVDYQRGEGGELAQYRLGVHGIKSKEWLSSIIVATR
jgi:hypothetical protein